MRHFALTTAASKEIKAKMKLNATLAPTPPTPSISACPAAHFPRKMQRQHAKTHAKQAVLNAVLPWTMKIKK